MPLLGESPQLPAERDDLDDLFNYDVSMDDAFKDDNAGDSTAKGQSETRRRNSDAGAGLGLDEEIKITKRRQPIAKLDEARYELGTNILNNACPFICTVDRHLILS